MTSLSKQPTADVGRSAADAASGYSAKPEGWRPVHGYAGFYEVSTEGRIRAAETGRILSTNGTDKDGYPVVSLNRFSVRKTHTLHRLVALSFHGDCCTALHNQVAHLDGNKLNAAPRNLKWVSHTENQSHRLSHGTDSRGEKHGGAKLTAEAVIEIRSYPKRRVNIAALADKFGVSPRTVSSVRLGRGWNHV